MKDYVIIVFALVAFILVFNSINSTREQKINMKHMQEMTNYCKQQGAVYYKESGSEGVCVKRKEKIE